MTRHIVLTPDIHREVYGSPVVHLDLKWKTQRRVMLQMELAHFVDGYEIQAALANPRDPFEAKPTADVRELHELEHEVWEFRARNKPPMRLFGRVADFDWFVALRMDRRDQLPAGSWDAEISDCKTKWDTYLPGFQPFKPAGRTIHDYFSNARPAI